MLFSHHTTVLPLHWPPYVTLPQPLVVPPLDEVDPPLEEDDEPVPPQVLAQRVATSLTHWASHWVEQQ